MTRKGFFASIAGAFFGAKVAPAKGIPWRHGVSLGVPSFKAGDRIAVYSASLPIGNSRLVSKFEKLQKKYVFRMPDLQHYPSSKYAGLKVVYRHDKVGG